MTREEFGRDRIDGHFRLESADFENDLYETTIGEQKYLTEPPKSNSFYAEVYGKVS